MSTRKENYLASVVITMHWYSLMCSKDNVQHRFLKLLDDSHILYITVPNNCTDRLQPLDVSVNKPTKDFLRAKFQKWYSLEIYQQLERGVTEQVDLRISTMKPVTAKWMIELHS